MQNNSFTPRWITTLANHENDPDHTVGMLKAEVFNECSEMVREAGYQWQDLYTRRSTATAIVKAMVCFHAYQCLHHWMDEREIATMLGLKLSGFKNSRMRGRDMHGACIPR
jgi:hypothetical protein